jgi:hypothetical protein
LAQPIAFSTLILKLDIILLDSFCSKLNSGLGFFFDFLIFFSGINIQAVVSQKSLTTHKYHKSSIKFVSKKISFCSKNSFLNIV